MTSDCLEWKKKKKEVPEVKIKSTNQRVSYILRAWPPQNTHITPPVYGDFTDQQKFLWNNTSLVQPTLDNTSLIITNRGPEYAFDRSSHCSLILEPGMFLCFPDPWLFPCFSVVVPSPGMHNSPAMKPLPTPEGQFPLSPPTWASTSSSAAGLIVFPF